MGGVYGEINSRADYERILQQATQITSRQLELQPKNPVMQRIAKELESMKKWSENGHEPSESERQSIDVGLIALREFEGVTGDIAELADKLSMLNNYFEDWPSDEKAASATDDDFWDDDEA